MTPDSNSNEPTGEDRRGQTRERKHIPVRLTLETEQLEGTSENVSEVGVLFFAEESLRVLVELEEDGKRIVRKGSLVRVERMSIENTGFAVKFDRD